MKYYRLIIWLMPAIIFSAVIAGCGPMHQQTMTTMAPPKTPMTIETTQIRHEGTIWQASSGFSNLFVNPKARKIGDIITIKIVESSSASNKATTNTGRSSTLTGTLNSFFNLQNKYSSSGDTFNPFGGVSGGLESTFEGNGTTSRSGDLSAYITARVVNVLPNGNLEISGTREVQVNNERQLIMLTGIIRSRDISPENVILSTYISDARIAYSGSGVVDERQRPGWVARILDSAWPF